MSGVLTGFAVIAIVIACGYGLAARGVIDAAGGRALSSGVFYLAMPCLLFSMLRKEDITHVFSWGMAVSFGSCLVSVAAFLALTWERVEAPAERAIGALTSCYVNAGNLGVPIAVYVLGSGAAIAPVLLIQLLVLAPAAFAVLDLGTGGSRLAPRRLLLQPLRNPVTVGTALGVLVSVSQVSLPSFLTGSIDLMSGLAVPGALLAYGVSLRTGPKPLVDGESGVVAVATTCKLLVQPAAAFLLAHGCGLGSHEVLACVVLAALPTAQNVFVYASTYGVATVQARDTVFLTTMLSLPVILGITACLA